MQNRVAVGAVALCQHTQRGQRERVVAAEHERHGARVEDLAQASSKGVVRAGEIARRRRGVAVVHDGQHLERIHAERWPMPRSRA